MIHYLNQRGVLALQQARACRPDNTGRKPF